MVSFALSTQLAGFVPVRGCGLGDSRLDDGVVASGCAGASGEEAMFGLVERQTSAGRADNGGGGRRMEAQTRSRSHFAGGLWS